MSRSARTPRVLILDDERIIVRLCSRAVHALGAQADAAGTVVEAAALIRSGRHDLLICDMRLPDGAGLRIQGLFRERNPRGRVIVITGSLTPGHPALGEARDEIVVLCKPFGLAQFRSAVAGILDAAAKAGAEE